MDTPACGVRVPHRHSWLSSIPSSRPESRIGCFWSTVATRHNLIIEAIQLLLKVHPSLEKGSGRRCSYIKVLVRLAGKRGRIPRDYRLNKYEGKVLLFQSPVVDIYKAGCPGRAVCLKQYRINPNAADNAKALSIREAIFWFNHQHPNVLPFLGVVETRTAFYLVSPYFEIGTLADYLQQPPTLDRRLLVHDIASGLHFFHSHNFVHADIKPQNIFVDASGRAVLADLGLSRLSDSDILTWPSVQTICPQLAPGIYPWLAPEILLLPEFLEPDKSGLLFVFTSASDVYALGGVIYEIFTGRRPFHDFSIKKIIQQVPQGVRPQKPESSEAAFTGLGLTEDIWKAIECCWDGNPNARPTMGDLLQEPFLVNLPDDRPQIRYES
ncbi:kinase-like protein [Coprinellus micaceus]|uniref:Kinase-like protein n=1 Tax=Coprinellus micaceus TaxID=71717 RepID=A0A4Y7TKJ4_COPMI|nr:kinase-like protein [Coprinellus micaceus]